MRVVSLKRNVSKLVLSTNPKRKRTKDKNPTHTQVMWNGMFQRRLKALNREGFRYIIIDNKTFLTGQKEIQV